MLQLRFVDLSEQGLNLIVSHNSFQAEVEQPSRVQKRSRSGDQEGTRAHPPTVALCTVSRIYLMLCLWGIH